MRRSLIAVASLIFSPSILFAQMRGGGVGHGSVAPPAAHFAAHAAASSAAMRTPAFGISHVPTGSHWVRTSSGLALRVPRRSFGAPVHGGAGNRPFAQDVPGLGFDFPHVAATHPQRGRGFHDRDRLRHQRFVGAFFPFFGGGGYWPLFPEDVEEEPSADYEQAEGAEPPYPPYPYRPPRDARETEAASQNAPAVAPEPEKPTDEYVFVRRDGTVFFAVAYMWENGNLRYVTSEGVRRSVAGTTLDLHATQQFNEQRGLTFRLPA